MVGTKIIEVVTFLLSHYYMWLPLHFYVLLEKQNCTSWCTYALPWLWRLSHSRKQFRDHIGEYTRSSRQPTFGGYSGPSLRFLASKQWIARRDSPVLTYNICIMYWYIISTDTVFRRSASTLLDLQFQYRQVEYWLHSNKLSIPNIRSKGVNIIFKSFKEFGYIYTFKSVTVMHSITSSVIFVCIGPTKIIENP